MMLKKSEAFGLLAEAPIMQGETMAKRIEILKSMIGRQGCSTITISELYSMLGAGNDYDLTDGVLDNAMIREMDTTINEWIRKRIEYLGVTNFPAYDNKEISVDRLITKVHLYISLLG